MNDFEGLLSSDYGFKPQGKSAPMAAKKPNNPMSNSNSPFNFEIGGAKTTPSSSSSTPLFDDHDTLFRHNLKTPKDDFSDLGEFGDVFSVGRSKSTGTNSSSVNIDSIFAAAGGVGGAGAGGGGGGVGDSEPRFPSMPVFDKPLYDEDVSSSAKYEDIFSSASSAPVKKGDDSTDAFDDLFGVLGKKENLSGVGGSKGAEKSVPAFDDLLPGFGGSTSSTNGYMLKYLLSFVVRIKF